MPNLQIMSSSIKVATTSVVAFFNRIALAHLVKYLVATKIQIFSFDSGEIGLIKFNAHM